MIFRTHIRLLKTALALAVVLVYVTTAHNFLDPDFGWRLKTGEWILEHRDVPRVDLFSFSMPDYPWVDHAWGADVIFAWIHRTFSYDALAMLISTLAATPFIYWLFRAERAGELALVLLAAITMLVFMGVRAQLFSLLFFFVLWLLLQRRPIGYTLLAIPLLFAAWSQIHGGFLAGLLLVFLMGVRAAWNKETRRTELKKWGVLLFLSCLATLANPYGAELHAEILSNILSRDNARAVLEWQPLNASFQELPLLAFATFALFVALTHRRIWPRQNLLFFVIFFVAGISSKRNWYFFLIAGMPLFLAGIRTTLDSIRASNPPPRLLLASKAVGALLFIGLLWWTWRVVPWRDTKDTIYPTGALATLRGLPADTRLFNEYDWGGWLIGNAPRVKTFIDGRMPYWEQNGESVMRDYLLVASNDAPLGALIEKYGLNAALVRKRAPEGSRLDSWIERAVEQLDPKYVSRIRSLLENKKFAQRIAHAVTPLADFSEAFHALGWEVRYEDERAVLFIARH